MNQKIWSPWFTGALTGLLAAVCCVYGGTVLGASGGFLTIGSWAGRYLNAPWNELLFFKFVRPPEVTFQLMQFGGMLLGAFTAARLSNDFKLRLTPDGTANISKKQTAGWGLALFLSGALIEFGACIAGGCTSGLGISGIIQQSPAGFLFFASAFASAIITSFTLRRLKCHL